MFDSRGHHARPWTVGLGTSACDLRIAWDHCWECVAGNCPLSRAILHSVEEEGSLHQTLLGSVGKYTCPPS